MAKKLNANDAAIQQKMRVLMKLRDSCIRSEKELQNMTTEMMLSVKDITVPEMHVIVDLQNSVKNGKLFSYLIEAQEILIPECGSGKDTGDDQGDESDASEADREDWKEGDLYA